MRVLLIAHGYPPAAEGGTEVYTRALARALAGGTPPVDVFVLTREADPCRPEYTVRRRCEGKVTIVAINNTFAACSSFEESYTNPSLLEVARAEIAALAPDIAHIQHLTCLSTGLPRVLAALEVPVVMTLNDYWLICHRGQLFDLRRRRCAGPFDGGCGACLPPALLAPAPAARAGRRGLRSASPAIRQLVSQAVRAAGAVVPPSATRQATLRRLETMREAASHVDLFLAPSATIESWFLRFGIEPARLRRCTQGIDLTPYARLQRTPSRRLRVGYAGGLSPSKAPHLLLEALDGIDPAAVSVDILGQAAPFHGDDSYAREIAPLLAHPSVRVLGAVPAERMPAVLARLDVLVVPSLWIENAPFIIREACAARVPVVAADLGGMAEMVRDGTDGLLFPPGDVAALRTALLRLLREPDLLERLRQSIRTPMSIEEDAAALMRLYASLVRTRPGLPSAAARPPKPTLGAVVLNYRTPEQTFLASRALQTSATVPDPIVVVDNGSGDGSAGWLRGALREVEVLALEKNLGFSGGCNAGLQRLRDARTDFALLVNSDVVLRPDAIDALVAAAVTHPEAGILAPVLLAREEPDRIASAGISYDPVTGRMRHVDAGRRLSFLSGPNPYTVDAVSGAVMLIRAAVLERAGLLDEAYFFSFEDIEFCLRAKRAGFSTLVVPEAIAYHEGGRSIGRRSPRRVYYAARNHLRLAQHGPGGTTGRLARAGLIVCLNAGWVIASREVPRARGLAAVARGVWHYATGRFGA